MGVKRQNARRAEREENKVTQKLEMTSSKYHYGKLMRKFRYELRKQEMNMVQREEMELAELT